MKRFSPSYFTLLLLVSFLLPISTMAQEGSDSNGSSKLFVDNADNFVVEKAGETFVRYMNGNVRILHDSTFFYCDTAIINDNTLQALGNVVILQADSTTVFSDSLFYNADSARAVLNGRVLLLHQGKQLRTSVMEYQVDKKIAYYENSAQVFQDSTILRSKRGIYKLKDDIIYFKEHVTIVDSSFQMKADSVQYDTRRKRALFTGPTAILQDSASIYCEDGYYDVDENNASFQQKAVYLENDVTAKANAIEYTSKDELITLAGNAYYKDDDQTATADTIFYYRNEDRSVLKGKVKVLSDENQLGGDYIEYNNKTGDFLTRGRSVVRDESTELRADYIDFSDEEGSGFAYGDVFLKDTSNNMEILCDLLYTFDNNERFKAYNDSLSRPLMRNIMDGDTLFLSADTLYSYDKIVDSDTFRILNAYFQVRIFHKDFQAISDSMSYDSRDSVFHLYHDPLMWSDTTQFKGDTISIHMNDDKIDHLHLRPNAMIINYEAGNLYNQIAGKNIFAYFREDSLDNLFVSGNAESLYYLKDEKDRYVGAIKTICSRMIFHFSKNDLQDIKYYKDPVSEMTSIKKEISNPQRLKGFIWDIDLKPRDKYVDKRIAQPRRAMVETSAVNTSLEESGDAKKKGEKQKENTELQNGELLEGEKNKDLQEMKTDPQTSPEDPDQENKDSKIINDTQIKDSEHERDNR
jgi:lipopolysaccharide export system protein LptA